MDSKEDIRAVPDNAVEQLTPLPIIKSTSEGPVIGNSLIKATDVNAASLFTNKEIGKLPIPTKLLRYRTRTALNIIGSVMEGPARINEPFSEDNKYENEAESTTENYLSVPNVTNNEVFIASTTEDELFFYMNLKMSFTNGHSQILILQVRLL